MTDNTNVDTQANGAGAAGNTNPSVSPQAGKPVEVTPETLAELVKELKQVKGEISGIYKRQDKDRNAFSEFMAEFKKQKQSGKSDDEAETAANAALQDREKQAKRDKAIEAILERFGNDVSGNPAGNGKAGTDEQAKVLAEYKLDANDADVITRMTLQGAEFRAAIADLAFRRATQQTTSPAASTTLASAPASTGDVSTKITKLAELQKSPTKNREAIAKLTAELDALNWGG